MQYHNQPRIEMDTQICHHKQTILNTCAFILILNNLSIFYRKINMCYLVIFCPIEIPSFSYFSVIKDEK